MDKDNNKKTTNLKRNEFCIQNNNNKVNVVTQAGIAD